MNRWSRAALAVGVALLPWPRLTPLPGLTRAQWADVAFVVALVLAAPAVVRGGRSALPRWTWLALGGYVAWSGLSLVASDDLTEGVRLLGARAFLGAVFVLFLQGVRDGQVRREVARVVAVNALVVAAAAVVALVLFRLGRQTALLGSYGTLTPSPLYARVQAGTGNPNVLASYGLFSLTVVVGFRRDLPRWLWRTAAAASVVMLLATLSKVAVAAVVIAAGVAAERSRRAWLVSAAAGLATLIVLTGSIVPIQVDPDRPWQVSMSGERTTRAVLAEASVEEVARAPVFGSGLGDLPRVERSVIPGRPHITLLDVAVSSGIPAAGFLVIFLGGCWFARRRPTHLVLWSGVAALAVDSVRQDVTHFRHVWIALAMAVALAAPVRSRGGGRR